MKKREAQFQIRFKAWLEENPPVTSTAYELKWVANNRFNFRQWITKQPHQLRGLLLSSTKGKMCYHKISDASYEKKPFDNFVMANADAFLVIWFESEKKAVMIDAHRIHKISLTWDKASATLDELVSNGGRIIRP